jgi:hypothetical protein
MDEFSLMVRLATRDELTQKRNLSATIIGKAPIAIEPGMQLTSSQMLTCQRFGVGEGKHHSKILNRIYNFPLRSVFGITAPDTVREWIREAMTLNQ